MPSRISWSELVPGIIALTVLTSTVIVVLTYTGVGRIKGDTVRLHMVTTQARGVIPGTEVWVSGQKVGKVAEIGFRAPAPEGDTAGSVVMTLRVRERDAPLIRHNSRVQVRSGTNVIGPVVVYIQGGTPDSPPVTPGDTIQARTQSDLGAAVAQLSDLTAEVTPLMADARTVMARLDDPSGTIGAFSRASASSGRGSGGGLPGQMTRLRARLSAFGNRAGPGPADVLPHARRALARVDSIRALLALPGSSFGRFRRDSTLRDAIGGVVEELSTVRALLDEQSGSLARFRSDSALMNSVAAARREMALLFEDVSKHPLRYLHF